jgi:hypothetical protein
MNWMDVIQMVMLDVRGRLLVYMIKDGKKEKSLEKFGT